MEARFRLAHQSARWARFADVTVRATPADRSDVRISAEAFSWRRAAYGPEAAYGEPFDAEAIAEARQGARYALDRLPTGIGPAFVDVIRVIDRDVDTGPGDVAFATAFAVWRALGHQPADPPALTDDGTPHFP